MVQYTLKSGTSIDVPADYIEKVEALIKIARESPESLMEAFGEHPYLENIGIWSRVNSLAEHPDSAVFQDAVFLRVCINLNEQRMRSPERDTAITLDSVLIRLCESAESGNL